MNNKSHEKKVKESIRYYAVYDGENPYLNSFNLLSNKVKIAYLDEEKNFQIKPLNLEEYPNVESLYELMKKIPLDQLLVVEVQEHELKRVRNCAVIKIAESKNKSSESKKENPIKYLVNYDFEIKNFPKHIRNTFIPCVLLKKPNEDTYILKQIVTVSDAINERKEDLGRLYGGLSGIYLEATCPKIITEYADDIIELAKSGVNSYEVQKIPPYIGKKFPEKIKN